MSMHIKVSGVWKIIKDIAVKISSTWKGIGLGWVKVSGVWKLFFKALPDDIIIFSTDSTDIDSWSKCNGSDVTLNLIGKYPRADSAQGSTGGSLTHTHGSFSGTMGNEETTAGTGDTQKARMKHTHTIDHTHPSNTNHEPEYLKVLPVTEGDFIKTTMFLFYNGSTPPSGWSAYSEAYDNFFKCDLIPEFEPLGGNPSHSHSFTGTSGSGGTGGSSNRGQGSKRVSAGLDSHTHSTSHTHLNGENYAPWVGLLPISPDNETAKIPSGVIAFFKGSTVPSGWSVYLSADGKFIQGKSVGSGAGGSTTHNHVETQWSGYYDDDGLVNDSAFGSYTPALSTAGHRHVMTHSHDVKNNEPPYQELMLLKKD